MASTFMSFDTAGYRHTSLAAPVHAAFLAFPIATFSLALVTDVAYLQTLNLLFLHFSEWLLLAGILGGILALVSHAVHFVVRRVRPSWLAVLFGVVVLLLAAINSFVHTADGWTAVYPWGLVLSALTVVAMIVTAWLGRRGTRHV